MFELRKFLRRTAALFAFLPALAPAALISDFEDTWTDGGTNYLIHGNVTDTSSAADSQLLGLSVGGTDKFYVLKDGTITVTGPIVSLANGDITLTPNGTGNVVLGASTKFVYDGSNYCTWVSAADGALNLSCLGTDADFNIDLTGATDGDFSVNTNDLFVDTSTGAIGLNTTSPNANSVLDAYGKIYQNGVQSLYNPSTFTGTIVVGDGGGSLSHTSGDEGYYNTFVGIGAGGDATTQNRVTAGGYLSAAGNTGNNVTANGAYSAINNTGNVVTANGYSSAYNNTGNYVTATGRDSIYFNTGNYVTATGAYSARNNTGNTVTADGYASAQNNTGNYVTADGYASAQNNTGTDVSANGAYSAKYNTGTNVVANGSDSAQYNSKDNVTALGSGAYNTWVNGSSYAISSADAGAATVTVTGHGITIGTYKPLKVSGAGVGGLINGSVYTFKAVDANTLQPLGGNITSSGTATLYANSNDFANVTALGYNAEPTKDNQVMLGDTNVIEVKTYAKMLDVNGAITAREPGADQADPDEGAHVCWQSNGTGIGDDGDIVCKITAGGTTKTTTLIDFSAL